MSTSFFETRAYNGSIKNVVQFRKMRKTKIFAGPAQSNSIIPIYFVYLIWFWSAARHFFHQPQQPTTTISVEFWNEHYFFFFGKMRLGRGAHEIVSVREFGEESVDWNQSLPATKITKCAQQMRYCIFVISNLDWLCVYLGQEFGIYFQLIFD